MNVLIEKAKNYFNNKQSDAFLEKDLIIFDKMYSVSYSISENDEGFSVYIKPNFNTKNTSFDLVEGKDLCIHILADENELFIVSEWGNYTVLSHELIFDHMIEQSLSDTKCFFINLTSENANFNKEFYKILSVVFHDLRIRCENEIALWEVYKGGLD